jgi:aspartate kinase
VAAVEIESARGLNSDVLRDVYAAFDRRSCPVDVMTASLGRLWLLAGSAAALPGIAADLREVANVCWENHKALVCLLGENIRRQPGVASRAFAAVSDMDVRVMCHGASDRTLSFLVDESRVEESVRRLHGVFFPAPREAVRDWGGLSAAFGEAG